MSVSRVLRDIPTVTKHVRDQVQAAIAQLNYVPNRAARLLSGASQFRVALLYNHPRSAYAVDLLMGAMEQAALVDVQLVLRGCTLSRDDAKVLGELIVQRIDAVVLTAPLCESAQLIALLADARVPAILIGTDLLPSVGVAMHIDEFAAAYEMTRHIVQLGHRRIGFITGGDALSASLQRLLGYRAALEESGIEHDEEIVVPGLFTYRSGLKAAERLLSLHDAPSAIFAANDDMAAGVVATAHRLGLEVPRQVSVCGFDDSEISLNTWPELTTIRQPVATMGIEAINILKTMLSSDEKDTPPRRMRFPHEIVVRGSDSPPSTSQNERE